MDLFLKREGRRSEGGMGEKQLETEVGAVGPETVGMREA